MSKIRLRFPPSPTGFLHIGNLRAALFNYLATKSMGGKLILRIEDTDQKREVEGAVKSLREILDWIGIEFDEGPDIGGKHGPYIQSERTKIYNKYIEKLLEKGEVYRCFCTPDRLEKMRADQAKQKLPPRYDRACRNLTQKEIEEKIKIGDRFVIRQKMPLEGEVIVHDELRGDIKFKAEDLDDHVLIKSNGIPTYQFASVVDDHEMEISHVLRGDEWISSFPKNILLYKSFGWTPPKFVHLPLVLNKQGGKLSKRDGDVTVENYKAEGYLPEAIINFCVLMGWHPKDDREILSFKELQKEFKLEDVGISPAVFDLDKLNYLNGYYIRQMELDKLVDLCEPFLKDNLEKTKEKNKKTKDFVKKVIGLEQERMKKLSEIGELTEFFFVDKLEYDENILAWKKMTLADAKNNLKTVYEILDKIEEKNWTEKSIEEALMSYIKVKELKVGEYLWPMRVALTGKKASPGPFEVAGVLGKEETLKRVTA